MSSVHRRILGGATSACEHLRKYNTGYGQRRSSQPVERWVRNVKDDTGYDKGQNRMYTYGNPCNLYEGVCNDQSVGIHCSRAMDQINTYGDCAWHAVDQMRYDCSGGIFHIEDMQHQSAPGQGSLPLCEPSAKEREQTTRDDFERLISNDHLSEVRCCKQH